MSDYESGRQLVDVVNESDEVIGKAYEDDVAARGLICRVSFIMLVNGEGELLLHQRSAEKKSYPLYWSGAAAGHLVSGESYEQAASREMREELGVETKLEFAGKFFSEEDREMVAVFFGYYDGPVSIQLSEVKRIGYYAPQRLIESIPGMRITSYVKKSLPMVLPLIRREAGRS